MNKTGPALQGSLGIRGPKICDLLGRHMLIIHKVGFWKIRVEAQGQVNEKAVKVEKYYTPKFEVSVNRLIVLSNILDCLCH